MQWATKWPDLRAPALVTYGVTLALLALSAMQGLSLPSTEGGPVSPLVESRRRPVVLFFVTTECPIANAMVPEMNRIAKEYSGRGVSSWYVNVEPEAPQEDLRRHAKEYSLAARVLLDRKHALARRLGITRTPEAAILDSEKLVYRGRVNDAYAELGKKRARITSHDVRVSLDAVLAGKPVPKPRTEAMGCLLPPLP